MTLGCSADQVEIVKSADTSTISASISHVEHLEWVSENARSQFTAAKGIPIYLGIFLRRNH